jgi:hypothetical protein
MEERLTRRKLMLLSAEALLATGVVGVSLADAAQRRWPSARLRARDAVRVNRSQFMPAGQLLDWQRELDAFGLRATGSAVHEGYVEVLHGRLKQAKVQDVHFEALPHRRWLADSWSLEVNGHRVQTASYIPYSGGTQPRGVTGPLVEVDLSSPLQAGSLRGRIALFSLPLQPLTFSTFDALAYKTYDPAGIDAPQAMYARAWLSITTLIGMLEALVRAEAAACVCVLDLPADAAHGAYYPYDGKIRPVPGVFVDRVTGASLRNAAAAGARARLVLRSQSKLVQTRNVVGLIPGASPELVLLHSHTDGPNAIEDNGPNAIVAISQYLARLPRSSLPRSVMVLLTTGHFAGGAGVIAFVKRHRHTTLRRTAAALTLEHLGAREWNPQPDGRSRLTGHLEPGTLFTPESSALVKASYAALVRAGDDPSSVLRPYVATPGSPDGNGWPAEGTQLWTMGHLPTANYITGPTYLLNWGIPTVDKLDLARMRAEAMSFTEMLLALAHDPVARLRRLDLLSRR